MKSGPRIAIHKNDAIFSHSTTWCNPWIEYCRNENLDFDIVDCYQDGIIAQLKDYDLLLWHFSHFVLQDMLFARSILKSAKELGLVVFPDYNTSWHFDDKVAESYLLEAAGAPVPKSWVFFSEAESNAWLVSKAQFPLVAKLRTGSGSNNVVLIEDPSQGVSYAKTAFRKGSSNVPNVFFKAKSNIRSAHSVSNLIKRAKRVPDFVQSWSRSKMLPKERGYAYFQEFIPNDGYDLKVVVIGGKASFFVRNVRAGDFRASGGGSFHYNRSLVSNQIIKAAFAVSDKLGFQCMGYDFVVDKRTNEGKIVEMSYGFSHEAVLQAGGYWDRHGVWHDAPINAPEEVLRNLAESCGP